MAEREQSAPAVITIGSVVITQPAFRVVVMATLVAGVLLILITKSLHLYGQIYILILLSVGIGAANYYANILRSCDEAPGSSKRNNYDQFHFRLRTGRTPLKIYNNILAWMLDAVDAFFGDACRADASWFTRATGWDTRGARWTANAYNRCLLLALLYPVAVILLTWSLTGKAGEGGKALLLIDGLPLWRRLIFLVALTISFYFTSYGVRIAKKWAIVMIVITTLFAGAVDFAVAGIGTIAGVVAGAVAVAVAGASNVALTGTIVVSLIIVIAGLFAGAVIIAMAGAAAGIVAAAGIFIIIWAERKNHFGTALGGFSIIFALSSIVAPFWLSSDPTWTSVGAWLLFFVLFTLVNAPFDWFALGLTRAFLRRGLAQGGWSPFLYALVDVVAAMTLVVALCFAMALVIQAFDDFAVLGGGSSAHILRFDALIRRLRSDPAAPENGWVWFTLFSSMLPSIINLTIACFSFLRGLPIINKAVLSYMPISGPISYTDRCVVVILMTGKVIIGVGVTMVLLYLLVARGFSVVMPWFSEVIITFAEAVSDANILAHWFAS